MATRMLAVKIIMERRAQSRKLFSHVSAVNWITSSRKMERRGRGKGVWREERKGKGGEGKGGERRREGEGIGREGRNGRE